MGAGVGLSNNIGIPDDHAYTLLGAYLVTDASSI